MGVVQGPDSNQDQNERFERLVNQFQASLLRTCYMYLRDQEQAEDAVQETFFKAYILRMTSFVLYQNDSHKSNTL